MSFFGSMFGSNEKKPQQSSRPPAPVAKSTAPAQAPDGGFFNLPVASTATTTPQKQEKTHETGNSPSAASGFSFVAPTTG